MKDSVSGVILAGGANKRFGGLTKSNIVLGGRTIISGIIEKISFFFEEIIIVTNSPKEFFQYNGITIASDVFTNAGPLGGIHSAMRASSREAVFVFAGDMPLLDTKIIGRQIELWESSKCNILTPRIGKNIEPLHSIYSKSVYIALEEYLSGENSHAVRNFFDIAGVNYFDLEENEEVRKAFTNINSPTDLERVSGNSML